MTFSRCLYCQQYVWRRTNWYGVTFVRNWFGTRHTCNRG